MGLSRKSLIKKLKPKAPQTRSARRCAMDYLARREHARVELEQKLSQKQYDKDEVSAVLDRLIQDGLQSDRRYCESMINNRVQQGYGPRRIEQELTQKGIDHAMIAGGLGSMQQRWLQTLKALCRRRFAEPTGDRKVYQKRYRFLLNRGFLPEQIREVLADGYHDIESD
jgi:regulatory protein